jgi:hypothetical protein
MKLLIMENNEVVVNEPWIKIVPELAELFRSRAGGKVKRHKEDAVKYLTYIYFMTDFASPIRDYEADEKNAEAIRFAGITVEEAKLEAVQTALKAYKELQEKACRPLRSHRAALKGLDAMDKYFETVDFDAVDKQGKLLTTTKSYVETVALIKKAYDNLSDLEKQIEADLTKQAVVRGNHTLGDKELRYTKQEEPGTKTWDEAAMEIDKAPQFTAIRDLTTYKDKR